jgi:hypothetical protein
MIDTLRNEGGEPPFASRKNLDVFCAVVPGADLAGRGDCYMIRTLDYSYYFRCRPSAHDYDVYCVAYDNRYLLPELEAAREPPGEKTAPGIAEKPDGAKERGKGAKPKDYDAR